jgi:Fe-S oxidoreductase
LIVEFYEDVAERLSILQSRKIGLRTKILTEAAQMNMVWSVRKSGLSLLTGCVGPAKPVAFIEDAAVRPAQLPEYVRGLQSIMKPLGLTASYYGHAASGLLHVRPVLDMHSAADLNKFRQVADETSALVRQFKGSLSAEHGVGIARTEYMRDQLGNQLLEVMREIKRAFDPKNVFNPGKIFANGSEPDGHQHKIDNHLRENFTRPLELPFQPVLAFAFKDRSFTGNLEQCNGCGGCLKQSDIMCPTFIATHDEVMSTRGRANIIRAALEYGFGVRGHVRAFESGDMSPHSKDPLKSAELDAALSNCLSCKGCTPECPSNVNLALLKAEMLYARWRRDGLPLRERILSNVDLLGKLGCLMPRLMNRLLGFKAARIALEKTIGISARRSLPHYANQRFDRWFSKRLGIAGASPAVSRALRDTQSTAVSSPSSRTSTPVFGGAPKTAGEAPAIPRRGKVILWDDTFVRYHEPHIGIAAVKVLEALGFQVSLVKNRRCCGRPAFSQGNLDTAAKLARHNVGVLSTINHQLSAAPILFLEPSCWSMFVDDYRELKIENAENIAARCFLFEKFVDDLLARKPDALQFKHESRSREILIHPHCHAKSITSPAFMGRLAERLPGRNATVLDTACCGMAGAFGALAEKYDLSLQVAQRLLDQIDNQPAGTEVIASGTSCRHQIADLTTLRPKHMAELLAEAL